MANTILIFFGAIVCTFHVCVGLECLNGWSRYEGSCYHVSHDSASWAEAMKLCELHQGRLAAIDTSTEQGFIENLLQQNRHGSDYWLAGSDWSVVGEWVWEPNSQPMNFSNWHHGEPDSGKHQEKACLAIRHGLHYQWASFDCQSRIQYICEMT